MIASNIGGGVALQLGIGEILADVINDVAVFLPRIIGALLVLLIGWLVGMAVGGAVKRLADRAQLDRVVLETPIGRMLGGTERAVSGAFGKLAKWFVYALALLAATNVLAIELFSEWMSTAVSYLPAFIAGLLVIVLGFVVADFIGDAITRTKAATETAYTSWFATGTRVFLYFTAVVIGLDTMGIDVGILLTFAQALAWGLAAALAIGIGIAVGWGGHDYVREHVDSWMGSASSVGPSSKAGAGDDDD
ncbi:hypothetical protein VB773_16585 [Haloarculaceae archaeon H-GB2-1]|nr:hypothetical protein [Haloarculaceae archaeon H-GB1-1]MEA5387543.1 hypothetical protein [Haloarculaceae archaeon H-GB11]MEA5409025.1 hypothetical protein [Haloarculaceae archaeon H-GB2-1]